MFKIREQKVWKDHDVRMYVCMCIYIYIYIIQI